MAEKSLRVHIRQMRRCSTGQPVAALQRPLPLLCPDRIHARLCRRAHIGDAALRRRRRRRQRKQ